MSETNYDQCHTSYRGYMNEEIDAAREMLRKYGNPCSDAVKELRLKTNMPLSECGAMLRCLWRDAELERVQSENTRLWELIGMIRNVCDGISEVCEYCKNYSATNDECAMLKQIRELGIEVSK